jgi:hypothetical protein
MIETLPLLVIFVFLLGFGLGFFGIVHTAILNSMAARTYAFETFRNRADLTFFRDSTAAPFYHYKNIGNRIHNINSENDDGSRAIALATTRNLTFGVSEPTSKSSVEAHNFKIYDIAGRNRKGGVEASPAWIMVGYGICLDAGCGD